MCQEPPAPTVPELDAALHVVSQSRRGDDAITRPASLEAGLVKRCFPGVRLETTSKRAPRTSCRLSTSRSAGAHPTRVVGESRCSRIVAVPDQIGDLGAVPST